MNGSVVRTSWFRSRNHSQAIREQAMFAVRVKSVALLFEPANAAIFLAVTKVEDGDYELAL